MYEFYLSKGDKLISFKPTLENYIRAYDRKSDEIIDIYEERTFREFKEINPEEYKKLLYLTIRILAINDFRDSYDEETIFQLYDSVCGMIGLLTPRELMNMFPIDKHFDGEKFETKDYFFTMKMIEKHGIDREIGSSSDTFCFLYDYQNIVLDRFLVNCMTATEDLHVKNGGKTLLEEIGLETFHDINGVLVSDVTGESVGCIQKKEPKKYMQI